MDDGRWNDDSDMPVGVTGMVWSFACLARVREYIIWEFLNDDSDMAVGVTGMVWSFACLQCILISKSKRVYYMRVSQLGVIAASNCEFSNQMWKL